MILEVLRITTTSWSTWLIPVHKATLFESDILFYYIISKLSAMVGDKYDTNPPTLSAYLAS